MPLGTWALSHLGTVFAASLPTYDDFRRVDRVRRLTGQLHTGELLTLARIDPVRLLAAARGQPDNWALAWGAAELLADWPQKRALFEDALTKSGTNVAVVGRFALTAALVRDDERAALWLGYLQKKDSDNLAPWLADSWLRRRRPPPAARLVGDPRGPPTWCIRFRDYGADAARARIHALETAGYSPYSARRLGYLPTPVAAQMARDLANDLPADEPTTKILLTVSKGMQGAPTYLLMELVGQSLESVLLLARPDSAASPEVRARSVELDQRREALRGLLAETEREGADFATEPEMVQYFDDLLALGEETAMKRLLARVQRLTHP